MVIKVRITMERKALRQDIRNFRNEKLNFDFDLKAEDQQEDN